MITVLEAGSKGDGHRTLVYYILNHLTNIVCMSKERGRKQHKYVLANSSARGELMRWCHKRMRNQAHVDSSARRSSASHRLVNRTSADVGQGSEIQPAYPELYREPSVWAANHLARQLVCHSTGFVVSGRYSGEMAFAHPISMREA